MTLFHAGQVNGRASNSPHPADSPPLFGRHRFRLTACLRPLARTLLLCALAPFPCQAEGLDVTLLLSDGSAPYQAFADAFRKSLPEGARATVLGQNGELPRTIPPTGLVVAAGTKAAELAASRARAPVLAVMITRAGYEALRDAAPSGAKISAIFLNQPWDRQLDFLRAALPERRRIGLLQPPGAGLDTGRLGRLVSKRGRSLVIETVPSPDRLYAGLDRVLEESDLLLATPDAAIYNSNTIRNILLASYRRSIPLVGFSQSYVNAGALCAIFSTPEQLAGQAGEAVDAYLLAGELPAPQYPAEFTIAVNPQVSRSLGIELPSQEAILDRMRKPRNGEPEGREG